MQVQGWWEKSTERSINFERVGRPFIYTAWAESCDHDCRTVMFPVLSWTLLRCTSPIGFGGSLNSYERGIMFTGMHHHWFGAPITSYLSRSSQWFTEQQRQIEDKEILIVVVQVWCQDDHNYIETINDVKVTVVMAPLKHNIHSRNSSETNHNEGGHLVLMTFTFCRR